MMMIIAIEKILLHKRKKIYISLCSHYHDVSIIIHYSFDIDHNKIIKNKKQKTKQPTFTIPKCIWGVYVCMFLHLVYNNNDNIIIIIIFILDNN